MRVRGFAACLVVVAAALASRSADAGDALPEPRLDRIDYAHPEKYVELTPSLGKAETLRKIAAEIEGVTAREKLVGIGAWVDGRLRYDAKSFDHWRDVDQLLADGTFGGCADHAEIVGAIARACGVPTVWVKTLDLDWIAWFRAHPDQPKSWNGHVFVEVHLDGRWRLLDATQKVLYDDYDVRQRLLPGRRLAYDKGGDPYDLLLSTRWEEWKKQTRRFVETLDMSLVPVGEGASVRVDPPGAVYVAADNPLWQGIADRCTRLGRRLGRSGNKDFEQWLPGARRGVLVVTCVGGRTVLPERYWPLLPVLPAASADALADAPSKVIRRKAADGTDVVLLLARDADAAQAAVAGLTLGEEAPAAVAVVGPRPTRTVYVVARTAEFDALAGRLQKLGLSASGGDAAFDKWMPGSRGGLVVVAGVGEDAILPEAWRALLPADPAKVREILAAKPSDVMRRNAPDGTDVVMLIARDKVAMKAAIEALALDDRR
jgi:hypothetical protein